VRRGVRYSSASERAISLPPSRSFSNAGPSDETPGSDGNETFYRVLQFCSEERAELRDHMRTNSAASWSRIQLVQKVVLEDRQNTEDLREQIRHLRRDLQIFSSKAMGETIGSRVRVQRKGVEGRGGQSRMSHRSSIEQAELQPGHACELNHKSLAHLAMLGNHVARRERLLREIMAVDGIPWGQAHAVLYEFDRHRETYYWLETLPYRLGITSAITAGFGSILLVFWGPAAGWYGIQIAGEELPEGTEDISELTVNQVGTWTWSWMEPMIGVASFVLLGCQVTRLKMAQLNLRTYYDQILQWRAKRLAKKFPGYDRSMLRSWAKRFPEVENNMIPIYERQYLHKGPTSGL